MLAVNHCGAHRCSDHISHSELQGPQPPGVPPLGRGSNRTLTRNICSVFLIPGLCGRWCWVEPLTVVELWPAEERPAHLVYITTMEAFYVALLSMNLPRIQWFIGWPGSAAQRLKPPKVLKKCKKKKKERMVCILTFQSWPAFLPPLSPSWIDGIETVFIVVFWTGAVETVSWGGCIKCTAGQINRSVVVHLSRALKARMSEFNLGRKIKSKLLRYNCNRKLRVSKLCPKTQP